MRTYEYLYETKATGFLDIDNIGEVALLATNDFLEEKILIIHTEMGQTKVIQYGPIFVDNVQPPTNVSYTFSSFDYSDYKIDKIIDKFINDPKFRVSQVIEIDLEEALDTIIDLRKFI